MPICIWDVGNICVTLWNLWMDFFPRWTSPSTTWVTVIPCGSTCTRNCSESSGQLRVEWAATPCTAMRRKYSINCHKQVSRAAESRGAARQTCKVWLLKLLVKLILKLYGNVTMWINGCVLTSRNVPDGFNRVLAPPPSPRQHPAAFHVSFNKDAHCELMTEKREQQ